MASAAPRQQQPARPEGRLTKGTAEPAPPGEGIWPGHGAPVAAGAPPGRRPAPGAGGAADHASGVARPDPGSHDPTISLPRQLRNSRDALPDGYVIVAHFYDVESGRKNLDERGHSRAHEQFDIPIPRDGGIQDLLAEAARPDRRFVAVISESIERVARRTYFGTKIEHELEQSGVALLAADEPLALGAATPRGGWSRKRATPVLTRRVKQAIAEWYVLQMLELSWDGFCAHTEQGWNIGKPCYGYAADKVPHPVPARRAEGKTKTRLIPDPARGPVVTTIFRWRALEQLGYDVIADRLNTDLTATRRPSPSTRAARSAAGPGQRSGRSSLTPSTPVTWCGTGGRRKKGGTAQPGRRLGLVTPAPPRTPGHPRPVRSRVPGRPVPPGLPHPRRVRTATRRRAGPTQLRSYVFCDLCGRRMFGKTRRQHAYYACQPDHRHHDERAGWYAGAPGQPVGPRGHPPGPGSGFFAERIFGPGPPRAAARPAGRARRQYRRQDGHGRSAARRSCDTLISDIERRQRPTSSPSSSTSSRQATPRPTSEYRQGIQRRFTELAAEQPGQHRRTRPARAAEPGHSRQRR